MWIKGNKFKLTEVWMGKIVATSCEEASCGFADLSRTDYWKFTTCIVDEHDLKVMRSRGQIHAK